MHWPRFELLLFTGCRKSEILTLKWEHVDFQRGCLKLPDSKTGAKVVPLVCPGPRSFPEFDFAEPYSK
jgi:integrase